MDTHSKPALKRIGILGGGQLGRMLALAGYPLGATFTVLDPSDEPCAGHVAKHIRGEFEQDYAALYELVKASDVVTYEFENVPVETARWLAERVPVYPPPMALEVGQDRITEKDFFRNLGIPTAPYKAVETRAQYDAAIAELGLPSVLKTRRFGYDGKGQAVIRTEAQAEEAWTRLSGRPLILEGFVPFDRELSMIAARGQDGHIQAYPLIENIHQDGILHRSLAPASRLSEELPERAFEYMSRVMEQLGYVGVLTIEFFQDGPRLIANEMAPRVHNSGHWTIEGAVTSQFENHIRAVAGWPLGSAAPVGASVLYNCIGTVASYTETLRVPGSHLHHYGKADRAGRKVGHVTITRGSAEELESELPTWDQQFVRK
ncbi:MAG: 5-(carboxyamino)imidazole ribonucleotide synthase [Fimbriiglobus sp.]